MRDTFTKRELDNPTTEILDWNEDVMHGLAERREYDYHYGEVTSNTVRITKRMVRFTRKEPINACPG